MPFTFSHPAIVLPLSYLPKRWTSMSGFIIGSMTPDFEYFLRLKIESVYSHTWLGLLLFDLPLGILLTTIYQFLIKDALIDHLPSIFNMRLSKFRGKNQDNYFVIAWCVLIGAFSHLLWDGFTHPKGYFVNLLPALSYTVDLWHYHPKIYNVIQHLSSLIGGLVIGITILTLKVGQLTKRDTLLPFWLITITVAGLVLVVKMKATDISYEYGNIIVTSIAGILLGLIFSSIITRRFSKAL